MPKNDRKPEADRGRQRSIMSRELVEKNSMVRGLGEGMTAAFQAEAELVDLKVRAPIYAADEVITHVYFPIDCVLSVVTRMSEGGMIEVGTIGREGCTAIPLIMGATATANDCYCQVPGRALKLSTEAFFRYRNQSGPFRDRLNRYLQAYVNFLGQLAGCNRLHTVYERCCRWLLLSQDRVGTDTIELTHEYLAMMLGSRRSGVSIALSTLRRAGYIDYNSGKIQILKRAGLEETTCECYAVAHQQFGVLLEDAVL